MDAACKLSASELASRIARGELRSLDVVEAHLARIAEVNPQVNAVVRVLAEPARAAAQAADRAVAAGEPLGPLHGVPFTVKENIDFAGLPTTWGVPALKDAVSPLDAPVVERMRLAGAIPIGRTNLPDMGLRLLTESSLHGITRNPWAAHLTAGGSSGGEAAALATGMTPLGLGNDLGGSLRSPANACGVASLRPSAGRIPHAGLIPFRENLLSVQLMMVQGPMARTVQDLQLALQVLAGAHPRDPWSIHAPITSGPMKRPMKVALHLGEPGQCEPAVRAQVQRAATALTDAGYDVREVAPPGYEKAALLWANILGSEFETMRDRLLPVMGEPGVHFAERFLQQYASARTVEAFSTLLAQREGIARDWSEFMAKYPLLLTPCWNRLPFAHGTDVRSPESLLEVLEVARPVLHANLLGLPSVCVPAGLDPQSGLPVGVLLTGPRFREHLCLEAALQVERGSNCHTPVDPRP